MDDEKHQAAIAALEAAGEKAAAKTYAELLAITKRAAISPQDMATLEAAMLLIAK